MQPLEAATSLSTARTLTAAANGSCSGCTMDGLAARNRNTWMQGRLADASHVWQRSADLQPYPAGQNMMHPKHAPTHTLRAPNSVEVRDPISKYHVILCWPIFQLYDSAPKAPNPSVFIKHMEIQAKRRRLNKNLNSFFLGRLPPPLN